MYEYVNCIQFDIITIIDIHTHPISDHWLMFNIWIEKMITHWEVFDTKHVAVSVCPILNISMSKENRVSTLFGIIKNIFVGLYAH